jgi:hypothetical protein
MKRLFIRLEIVEADSGDPWAIAEGKVSHSFVVEMGSADTPKVQFTTGRLLEAARQLIENG